MTKGRAAAVLRVVAEQKLVLISPVRPVSIETRPRGWKAALIQRLLSPEARPFPLSSRSELRRSVVERSAVSAVLSWKCVFGEPRERSVVRPTLLFQSECFG